MKLGVSNSDPTLDPKTLNVHQLGAGKPIQLATLVGLPVEESRVQFTSREEASQAGKLALKQFLQHP
jgi:hypothetical protein